MKIWSEVGVSNPTTIINVAVLPNPLRPKSDTNSPASIKP